MDTDFHQMLNQLISHSINEADSKEVPPECDFIKELSELLDQEEPEIAPRDKQTCLKLISGMILIMQKLSRLLKEVPTGEIQVAIKQLEAAFFSLLELIQDAERDDTSLDSANGSTTQMIIIHVIYPKVKELHSSIIEMEKYLPNYQSGIHEVL